MFVHAKHSSLTGSKSITIFSSDTDVVVLAIALYPDLNINALWLAFRKGNNFRWMPIHDNMQISWSSYKGIAHFSMLSQDVILFLHLLARARSQHGRPRMWMKMPQKFFVASV